MCKYGLLYLVASAIAVLRVQLRFVDCINKRKKKNLYSAKSNENQGAWWLAVYFNALTLLVG